MDLIITQLSVTSNYINGEEEWIFLCSESSHHHLLHS
jgi:hypothetical protein